MVSVLISLPFVVLNLFVWRFLGLLGGLFLGKFLGITALIILPIIGFTLGSFVAPIIALIVILAYAVGYGPSYWLLLGLYNGLKQENVDEQSRDQFNQGIRCSLRNGLLISLIGAIIIATTEFVIDWLVVKLREPKGDWLIPLLLLALVGLIAGMVVMWALSGGPTVLRHYVIRWLLARQQIFPFHAQVFLEDATSRILLRRVGGGYSFIHGRLQDYFAAVATPNTQGESK